MVIAPDGRTLIISPSRSKFRAPGGRDSMEIAKPRQSLTGIVGAEENRVWGALLEPRLT